MATWEYAELRTKHRPPNAWTCTWIGPDGSEVEKEETELSALNRTGAEGWEMIGRSEDTDAQLTRYTFKRPCADVESSPPLSAMELGSAPIANAHEFQQCMHQITKLMLEFGRLMSESTNEMRRTPTTRLAVSDKLTDKLMPLADSFSIVASNYKFLAGEICREGRARLTGIKAAPRDYWDEATLRYLKSCRGLVQTSINSRDKTQKFHDSLDGLKKISPRLAQPLQRIQSAAVLLLDTRPMFEEWLKELKDTGY